MKIDIAFIRFTKNTLCTINNIETYFMEKDLQHGVYLLNTTPCKCCCNTFLSPFIQLHEIVCRVYFSLITLLL